MNKYVIDSTVFFKVQDESGEYHTLIGCIVDYKYDIETYKFRLYPNEEQKVLLNKHFGCVRFVYNWALNFNTT